MKLGLKKEGRQGTLCQVNSELNIIYLLWNLNRPCLFVCFLHREHAMLAKTAGVKHLVILVNKMDDPTVEWDKTRLTSLKFEALTVP